jgi:arsenate reductase (thioredoxin)
MTRNDGKNSEANLPGKTSSSLLRFKPSVRRTRAKKQRVLFVCFDNSVKSQMAEGILRSIAGDEFEVFSAGIAPKELHPSAVEVMNEIGVDISHYQSKALEEFTGQSFDYVITVFNDAKHRRQAFPGVETIHMRFEDPSQVALGTSLRAFRRVRDEIVARLRLFITVTDREREAKAAA